MASRRDFLKAAGAAMACQRALGAGPLIPRREFRYGDVQLTGGPLKAQYDRTHAHFLSLNDDRLLKVYRQRAGLPAPGEDMGGWYDTDGFVPGHSLGQYISGLSRFYANSGDRRTAEKVRALVDGFAATLGPRDYPYASEKAAVTWPCYVLDKYEIGMLDAYQLAGVERSRELLARVIRGAIPHIPDHTYDRGPDSPKQAPYDEPYILPENLFRAWEATGERQFLDMARVYLLDDLYFDLLAQGRNVLPGKHAYSHAIALSSAAKAYEVLGDRKYLRAIRNAWDMIGQTQQFSSGGWGPKEAFVPPHEGKLGEAVTSGHEHFETPCGAYAHTKLARYLLRFTGEARYGDGLERVLYNTILASLDPGADGEYFYYSDYHAGARKGYYKKKWPCCSGTLAQCVADYPLNLYFHGDGRIDVNLYAASEVAWSTGGIPVKLIQSTGYPLGEEIEIRVETPRSVEFTMGLRIPGWLEAPAQLSIQGKPAGVRAEKGTFAVIRRRWQPGDTVHLRLPMRPRTEAVDDRNPKLLATMKGPVLLVKTGESMMPFFAVRGESYTTYDAS